MAVIRCLNEHLIDYMPEHKKDAQSINSEINRVIDNYRLIAFESTLLDKRLDSKFKNKTYEVDIQTKNKVKKMMKTIKIKDITDIETVNKICKQPQSRVKDKNICFDCPLFLGFACYANIMFLIDQEIEVDEDNE